MGLSLCKGLHPPSVSVKKWSFTPAWRHVSVMDFCNVLSPPSPSILPKEMRLRWSISRVNQCRDSTAGPMGSRERKEKHTPYAGIFFFLVSTT